MGNTFFQRDFQVLKFNIKIENRLYFLFIKSFSWNINSVVPRSEFFLSSFVQSLNFGGKFSCFEVTDP